MTLGAPDIIRDYEEGTVGGSVTAAGSPGVKGGAASREYDTTPFVGHGAMSVRTFPGLLFQDQTSQVHTGSVYMQLDTVGTVAGVCVVFEADDAVNTPEQIAVIRAHGPSGFWDIGDNGGLMQDRGTIPFAAGEQYRLDWQFSYPVPGEAASLTLRIFIGDNIEGTVPDETLTAPSIMPINSAPLYQIRFGPNGTGYSGHHDTIRFWNDTVADWPGPYVVAAGGWQEKSMKVWDGSAWITKPVKEWDGSAWVAKPLNVYMG